ncbi:MAG TPA: PsiF family protein [Steroidobacteraceae bacterium]|jgi:hypothetical protein
MIRHRSIVLCAAVGILAAFAVNVSADNAQNDKMTSCNADAKSKNLSGDDRKTFMKTCLSAAPPADTTSLNSQQQKMKTCNADAKTKALTGDARKQFMSTCLKGS